MPAPGFTKWEDAIGMPAVGMLEDDIKEEQLETATSYDTLEEATYRVEEVIATAERDVNMLAGLAMPTVFQYMFPPVLLAAWHLLTQSISKVHDFTKIALGIPRGHAKTTLTKLFILFCILFTKKKFILVIGSTATLAENIIADVVDMLNEPNIQRLFGDWKLGIEIDRQDLKKFGFRGRVCIIAALGAQGSLRGLNIKNERPDVMIFDDVQTKECAESDVMSGALERWMLGTAMKAKSPHGCLYIFNGNMYPGPNSILKKLKANPNWIKFISGAILADGSALWEQLHPLETLLEELDNDIASGHPEIFFSEVMNDTEIGVNTKVDFNAMPKWPYGEHEIPQGRFILIDPSGAKQGSDAVAIGYFEVFDGIPGLRKGIEEQLSPGNTIRKALLMALQNNCRVIAVESVGYQSTLLYWFNEIATKLEITGFYFVEVYPGAISKNARIINMTKQLTAQPIELLIHDECRSRVMHQISNWNPLKRQNVDNTLDLLTYASKVLEMYPHLITLDSDPQILEAMSAQVQEDNHCF